MQNINFFSSVGVPGPKMSKFTTVTFFHRPGWVGLNEFWIEKIEYADWHHTTIFSLKNGALTTNNDFTALKNVENLTVTQFSSTVFGGFKLVLCQAMLICWLTSYQDSLVKKWDPNYEKWPRGDKKLWKFWM